MPKKLRVKEQREKDRADELIKTLPENKNPGLKKSK